jgi:hypothetical protein
MEVSVGIQKHNSTGAACKGTKHGLFLYDPAFAILIPQPPNDSGSQPDQRSGDPHFDTIVACTIGFCLIRQSSAGPIAIPGQTRIGSVNAHNSVCYFNHCVDRSVTNLAVQFRLGILPKRRSRPGSPDIVDLRADGTCLSRMV